MTLLKNAIHSIEAGIQDYMDGNDRRNLTAVRNVFSGILLLFKEKLVRLSPEHDKELLIKKDIIPIKNNDGTIIFHSQGIKTIDFDTIKKRFKSLEINFDEKKLDEINKLRNEIEHKYTSKSHEQIREVLAESFVIVKDFLVNELGENPIKIIDRDCWYDFLNVQLVYEAEKKECLESLQKIGSKYDTILSVCDSFRCIICDSALVKHKETTNIYITLTCTSCGSDFDLADAVEYCIKNDLDGEAFIAVKDGGEAPYDTCPECDRETFVFSKGACLACDYVPEYSECAVCYSPISLEEQALEGVCSYHFNQANKDD